MGSNTTKIWDEFKKGTTYADSMGFTKEFPKITEYYEGKQWPDPTKKTKNLPRPVFNITKMFIDRKRANVTNQSMAINFRVAELGIMEEAEKAIAEEGASLYSAYTQQLLEDMDMDEKCNELVGDAASFGTGIIHFYWDNSVQGGQSVKYTGDVRCEIIDPLDIVFARPKIKDEQAQEYIIIRSRETVESVKNLARSLGLPAEVINHITADEDDSTQAMGQKSVGDDGECTLLTKYFKKNGQVCFAKATKTATLIEERYLTPASNSAKPAVQPEDGDEMTGPEEPKPKEPEAHVIDLYPIVVMQWAPRKKSIFGIGEAQDIIPINRAYNFLKAMQLLSIQDNGWPKTVVKKGMLEGTINNVPGEVLIEKESQSIRYLQPPSPTTAASSVAEEIFEMSRIITGVTDVSTGESIGAGMSAAAIIALQNQAKTPVREMKRKYKQCWIKTGRILLEFYKTYYSLPRNITVGDNEEVKQFIGTSYAGYDFKIAIDVGEATEYADELTMTTLDKLYDRDKITLDQYMELAPSNVVPFKGKLQEMMKEAAQQQPEIDPTMGGMENVMQ